MIRVSAPGSVMLLGEHAVLCGYPAVVAAVSVRLTVELRPRAGRRVAIESALGRREAELSDIEPEGPLRFVEAAIVRERAGLPSGFDLSVRGHMPSRVGLGSSAAVTVAVLAALWKWTGRPLAAAALHAAATEVIRQIQGAGSGADAAASVGGGVLLYRADPMRSAPLGGAPPMTLVFSGSKTPTAEVIGFVRARRAAMPAFFDALLRAAGAAADEGAAAVRDRDWPRLGRVMNAAHAVMEAMGLETPELRRIVEELRSDPGIHGAKISGSGLGDCAVGIGERTQTPPGPADIPVRVDPQGVRVEAAP